MSHRLTARNEMSLSITLGISILSITTLAAKKLRIMTIYIILRATFCTVVLNVVWLRMAASSVVLPSVVGVTVVALFNSYGACNDIKIIPILPSGSYRISELSYQWVHNSLLA
jgi:hypothetical protein